MNIKYEEGCVALHFSHSDTTKLTGISIGGFFAPVDMIKKLNAVVDKYDNSVKLNPNECMVKQDTTVYKYYQWDGNPEAIKSVDFLESCHDQFKIGGNGYGNLHLDYCYDEIIDVYPGDYIIDKVDESTGYPLTICRKDSFENRYRIR